jgi:ribosome-associated translation inhibitor RaiA
MAKRTPPVNSRKQPLGVDPERTRRATRGRTTAMETPVEIRAPGIDLSDALEPYVRTKLGAKLGAFAMQIERVSVRFRDLNGPRGGEDIECRIQVVLAGRPDIVLHARAEDPRRAFDGANRSVGQAVRRDLERAGWSQGLRATQRRARASEPGEAAPAQAKAAPRSKARAKPAAKPPRKGAGDMRTNDPLALRARERAHTPAAHATTARAKRK